MSILTNTTDDKARLTLPKDFANTTVLVEKVSDNELRVRKARVIAEDDIPFIEETMTALSDPDRDVFLALLENPPPPNEALKRLLSGSDSQSHTHLDKGPGTRRPVDLISLTWPEFFSQVSAEQNPPGHLMHERLEVIKAIRQLFSHTTHFRDLAYLERRKVAGLFKSASPNFLLFGSMRWVGLFKQAVKDNNEGISLALDEIPLEGDITRDQYQRFTDRFLSAFRRSGMALASRLLAMKRPDTFVCVNNQNRDGLFEAFRVAPSKDADTYWELIERVRACTWWNAPSPATGDEREVWRARAAFLDALFYAGV